MFNLEKPNIFLYVGNKPLKCLEHESVSFFKGLVSWSGLGLGRNADVVRLS